MSSKAKSKKDEKALPAQGTKITSFFTKTPAPSAATPKQDRSASELLSPSHETAKTVSNINDTPLSKLPSPNTASSGAKTTTGKNKRRRVLDSDSEEEDDHMRLDDSVPTGTSLTQEAILAAKEAKASSSSRIGDRVEVRGDDGAWEKGKLVRHNISGTWMVLKDDGNKVEVSIPSDSVRCTGGSEGTAQSEDAMQEDTTTKEGM